MKQGKRILLFLLALLFMLPRLSAAGATTLTFTSVNNTLLPLSDDTMPTQYGSTIYLPYSIFNSLELGTYAVYSPTSQKVTVFTEDAQIIFDLRSGETVDSAGESYTSSAISRNGRIYLPVSFTCDYFGITHTTIITDYGPILRLKVGNSYDDRTFAKAAAVLLQSRLDEYYASIAPAQDPAAEETRPAETTQPEGGKTGQEQEPGTGQAETTTGGQTEPQGGTQTGSQGGSSGTQTGPGTGTQTTPQPPAPEEPAPPDRSDTEVYLSFYGLDAELTPRILDALANGGVSACFFLSAEDIAANPDLARRIAGSGNGIGLIASEDPARDYADGAALLYEAAHCGSFLLTILSEAEEAESPVPPEGPVLYAPRTVPGDYSLGECRVTLSTSEDRVDLQLLTTQSCADMLGGLLRLLKNDNYNMQLLTEGRAAALDPES